jgi:isoleucyl-tRNA synthetase
VADGLSRLVAPILSVTADEVWQHLPGRREASVHLADFPVSLQEWHDDVLESRWRQLLDIRSVVNQALEGARQRKEIGSALAAHVVVRASGAQADLLEGYRADLPMLLITSEVSLERISGELAVEVRRASGEKCPRCWRIVGDVGPAGTCLRCADAMKADDAA